LQAVRDASWRRGTGVAGLSVAASLRMTTKGRRPRAEASAIKPPQAVTSSPGSANRINVLSAPVMSITRLVSCAICWGCSFIGKA
jgi:hypothetical protein